MNSNALHIKEQVARFAVFGLKHILVTIEPSFSSHDVWSMSKARFEYEWEVKQSMSDLYREAKKPKHNHIADPDPLPILAGPNRFYIVVPKNIGPSALKWVNARLPHAGVVYAENGIVIAKEAPLLHRHRADLIRCSRVARWMAVTVADLMGRVCELPARLK